MTMAAVNIFFPCYELATSSPHRMHIAVALRAWLNRTQGEIKSDAGSARSRRSVTSNSNNNYVDDMYSKSAFDKCLAEDSRPLFRFAASKEFSGENIMFLDAVRDWKASWATLSDRLGQGYNWDLDPSGHQLHLFRRAVGIYVTCVDLDSAQFPINIESQIYARLHDTFAEAARRKAITSCQCHYQHEYYPVFHASTSPTGVPDDDEDVMRRDDPKASSYSMEQLASRDSSTLVTRNDYDDTETTSPSTSAIAIASPKECISQKTSVTCISPETSGDANGGGTGSTGTVLPDGISNDRMPCDFGIHQFDAAEKSIRSLVFACTWPKFVLSLGSTEAA